MDQTFFVTPFASLGDQTSIPIPTDPGGVVTMQQGWGPDYQRDQTTDPLAKDIDRANTNWLFYVITQAIAALQATGIPEWITTANNNGVAKAYPKYAQVRYSATTPGVVFETYVSTVDNNTSVPGADGNWQPIASIVAAGADVVAGTSSRLIVTPLSLKSYPGNTAQTLNVAAATAAAHAAQAQQVQQATFNYAVAGGTANALTVALSPAPAAYTDDLAVVCRVSTTNSGATTLAVSGLAATAVVNQQHTALAGGELVANGFAIFRYSSALAKFVLQWSSGVQLHGIATFTSNGSFTAPVTGTYYLSGCGAGGGGGSSLGTNSASFVTGGSGGGAGKPAIRVPVTLTAGQVVPITLGTAGTGATAAANNATAGTATQFGTSGSILNLAGGSAGSLGAGGTALAAYGGPVGGAGFPNGGSASDTVGISAGVGTGGYGGLGASGPFGSAGPAGRGAAGGSPPAGAGYGYGAGGSGAGGAYQSSVTAPGGAGAAGMPGFAMIEW